MEGVKASFADQRRLLDLADADLAAEQADHARRNPAQAARVKELLAERATHSAELTRRLGARDDAKAELARIQSDVAVVDARTARDNERQMSRAEPAVFRCVQKAGGRPCIPSSRNCKFTFAG